jgi:hypothetical protein
LPLADQIDCVPDAPRKPQDGRLAPLGELASAIARSGPRGRPAPALRAKRRFKEWKTEIGRDLAEQSAKARTSEEAAFAQQAYEAKLASGPDWMRYRGDSKIMDAPEVRISDELEARILKRFEKTVRLALRYPAGVPAKVLTALKGGAIWRVLGCLLRLAKKFGRVFPSLAGLASRAAAACAGQTAHNAKEALVELGFLTKHRRVQEIETPHGRKIVQDRNAYEIHLPAEGSLGDRIVRGDLSESKIERAKASPSFSEQSFLPDGPKTTIPEAERTLVWGGLHALGASLGPQPAT